MGKLDQEEYIKNKKSICGCLVVEVEVDWSIEYIGLPIDVYCNYQFCHIHLHLGYSKSVSFTKTDQNMSQILNSHFKYQKSIGHRRFQ